MTDDSVSTGGAAEPKRRKEYRPYEGSSLFTLADLPEVETTKLRLQPTHTTAAQPRKKSGRPHKPDDEWAWEQIHELKRPALDVKKEWLEKVKADPVRKNNVDLDRHFNRIMKLQWGQNRD